MRPCPSMDTEPPRLKPRIPIDEFLFAPGNPCALTCTGIMATTVGLNQPDTASNYTRMLERQMIGWCRFSFLTADDADLTAFVTDCNSYNIAWLPDYGSGRTPMVFPTGTSRIHSIAQKWVGG